MSEVVTLSRSLYEPEAVNAAIKAYEQLATFVVEADDDLIRVSISEIDSDVSDIIADEFSNHALFETIKQRGPA
jgi:hypothetical protein